MYVYHPVLVIVLFDELQDFEDDIVQLLGVERKLKPATRQPLNATELAAFTTTPMPRVRG